MVPKNFGPHLLSIFFLLLQTSCFGKKNTISVPPPKSEGYQNTSTGGSGSDRTQDLATPTPGGSGTNPSYGDAVGSSANNCFAPGVGTQNFEYYRIPVKGHGVLQGDIMWSSASLGPEWSQNIFQTDSRLHIRVVAKPNPKTCYIPPGSPGHGQPNYDEPYSQLRLAVTVRAQNQAAPGYFEKISFSDIKVNQCSDVRAFANIPVTDDPLILEVRGVESDFYCLKQKAGQVTGTQYCPYTWVDSKACWEIELQFATDDTKSFP